MSRLRIALVGLFFCLRDQITAEELHVTLVLDVFEFSSAGINLTTRAYNQSLPGPPIRVRAGDTVHLTLINALGDDEPTDLPSPSEAVPVYCDPSNCTTLYTPYVAPNSTNIHTHGLHTSPLRPGDDVLNTLVPPQQQCTYTYQIPKDHMAGTFWYHPHHEGNTAIQTAGGAAGILIVEDEEDRGVPSQVLDMPEILAVIQTVPKSALLGLKAYSGDRLIVIKNPPVVLQLSDNNQYTTNTSAGFDPELIDNVALLDGRYQPELSVTAGKWYRMRFVHAGPAFFLDLSLPADQSNDDDHPRCTMQVLAKDGVYLKHAPREHRRVVLPPGGRADVALMCKGHGSVRLSSGETVGSSGSFNGDMLWSPRIATLRVHSDDSSEKTPEMKPFSVPRPNYLRDLIGAHVDEASFVLNFTNAAVVSSGGVSGLQQLRYPYNADTGATCLFNGQVFNRSRPVGQLQLGAVYEWTAVGVEGHPLHVHVNPMQVVAMSTVNASTQCDQEYGYTCIGDFVDTLQVPQPTGHAQAKVRFSTTDFVGPQVLHCHYLVHEDLGCLSYHNISVSGS
eukprot:TRINITY_DN6501_c0_g2_i1.p1 TRINITY_DN6501_c0_g2~~TRINITY_DN6501_c0_g2_i1.p1  ORF type:complete len:562 (+),score=67.34 TRINITY_DN6501_c0_g2_i1:125-1810(+)